MGVLGKGAKMVSVDPHPPSEGGKGGAGEWSGGRERDDRERDKGELCWQLAELAVQSDSQGRVSSYERPSARALNQVLRQPC